MSEKHAKKIMLNAVRFNKAGDPFTVTIDNPINDVLCIDGRYDWRCIVNIYHKENLVDTFDACGVDIIQAAQEALNQVAKILGSYSGSVAN